MTLIKIFYTYISMMVVFLAIDLVWLGFIAKGFYRNQIGVFMRDTPNWAAALIFYALFLVGVMFFCIFPAIEKKSVIVALTNGALFGFFTYMTYEMTNYAVLKDWPLAIVPVDILWGAFLTAVVSMVGYYIANL